MFLSFVLELFKYHFPIPFPNEKLIPKFCTSFAVEKMVLYTIHFPTFITSIIRFYFPFVQFFITIANSMEDLILEALEVCFIVFFRSLLIICLFVIFCITTNFWPILMCGISLSMSVRKRVVSSAIRLILNSLFLIFCFIPFLFYCS